MSADEWFDANPNPMLGRMTDGERTRPVAIPDAGPANARLLRALLTWVEDNPQRFDTTTYGETGRPCGPVADLAGWTLLLTGWELTADNTFKSPDGAREVSGYAGIEAEAQALLGLSDDELWNRGDLGTLFDLPAGEGVARLRELAEQAEAAVANA